MAKAVRNKWLSTDSYRYFTFIRSLADQRFLIRVSTLTRVEQQQLLMLYYDLYQQAGVFDSLQQMVDDLGTDMAFCEEP